jgi:carbamoyl-phosphate synthase large subunit
VVGVDAKSDNAGMAFVDVFSVVPSASEEDAWLETIEILCRLHSVHAILPGCEPEIHLLAKRFPYEGRLGGAVIVSQSRSWIDRYGDKLCCMNSLEGKIELAPYSDGTDRAATLKMANSVGYPLVVKPRRGSGSVAINVVSNEESLLAALESCPAPLVQGYINDDGGEFSVGLFACPQFRSAISFRRKLGHGGASWFADNTQQDLEVLAYCRKVGELCELRGACNVQVRKGRQGVQLLEVNPRFSSLVAARAACGFADLEWSLLMALGLPFAPPSGNYRSIRYLRFVHELVDFGDGFEGIDVWQPRAVKLGVGYD